MPSRLKLIFAILSILALSACGSASGGGDDDQLVIATYPTGTATYIETAAVAEAMTKKSDIRTRIITSDTATGRLTPLVRGGADFARLGAEYFYSFEADDEFANAKWGPQHIRMVWGPPTPTGFATLDSSKIKTPKDLAGHKIPYYPGNPSGNAKISALLEAGGLTKDDVKMVDVEYGSQPDALEAGRIDVVFLSVNASSLVELDGRNSVSWMTLDPKDKVTTEALAEYAPDARIDEIHGAAGQEDGEKVLGLYYPVPIVGTDKTPDADVKTLLGGIIGSFDNYKDTNATTPLWSIDEVELVPQVVPFHDELIATLKEEGKWTDEAQKAQDKLLKREKALDKGWAEVSKKSQGDALADDWAEWKKKNLD